MTINVDDVVSNLLAAYRDPYALFTPPADVLVDEKTVYRIQQGVADSLGPVGGFKTGRTGPGETSVMAPIFSSGIVKSGARIARSSSRLRGVELEIGFQLITDPPQPGDDDFLAKLRAAAVLVPALEIVECRLSDPDEAGSVWKLADNQINGGLVTGEPLTDWRSLDLANRRVRLSIGDRVIHDGPADAPGGDAFDTFAAFVRLVGQHCGGLKAGQTVITGSFTGLNYAAAGDRIEGVVDGVGAVCVAFE